MFLYNLLISCINHSWPSICLSISVTSVIIYNSHYCPKYLVRYNKQQSRKSSNVDPQSSKKITGISMFVSRCQDLNQFS